MHNVQTKVHHIQLLNAIRTKQTLLKLRLFRLGAYRKYIYICIEECLMLEKFDAWMTV